jgi:ABC-2 type transport system ATP-binding protein
MATLRLERVSFRYPGASDPVLREVTLDIPGGGVFGLLGPNGAGKTTLISIVAGQLGGASGEIVLDGEPLAALRRARTASLGLVPQECAFYPMLSCRENLHFFGGVQDLHGRRLRERIDAVAGLARIENVLDRPAGKLSGGLKRRLNLAIGLLTEPRILLLDEPTVGVDPQSRAFLLETIRSLARADHVIVYTSHYMEEVQAICDRVAILDRGRVLVSGPLTEVLQDGSGLLSLRLSAPLPPALHGEWRLRYALHDEGDGRYRLQLAQASEVEKVVAAALAADCRPLAIAYCQRDLEHVFMQLTQRSLRE